MTEQRLPLIERIANDFRYHPPGPEDVLKHEEIRDESLSLARTFHMQCPSSRELALALTSLEEAMMWANAAIARNK